MENKIALVCEKCNLYIAQKTLKIINESIYKIKFMFLWC